MGTSVASDYMSVRSNLATPGTNGWTTHATTPFQEPNTLQTLGTEPLFVGDLSPDLRTGVFQSSTSLTDDANVANVPNLYLRGDMRTPGRGGYQLLTPCPQCDLTGPLPMLTNQWIPVPAYAGASNDLQTVAVESLLNLTGDAPAQADARCATFSYLCSPRAYEWRDGGFALAGLIPPGSDITCGGSAAACVAAEASIWGQGAGTTVGVLTLPGYPGNVVSDDGSRMFFTGLTDGQGSGRIYARNAGATTDEITASERTDCAGDQTCGGDGVADPAPDSFYPSKFWGASADGSRVFFTSGQALTDDAPVGGDRLLYMYDANKPASDPHNLTWLNVDRETAEPANDVETVLAVSDNGRYVYFMTNGQLVADAPPLGLARGIFMWHDGEIAYIGKVADNENAENSLTGSSGPQTRITPDGRHLVFTTHDGSGLSLGSDHSVYPNNGFREIYLYSADTHALVCVSCNPSGAPATADAQVRVKVNEGGQKTAWHINGAITEDASRVFFSTGEGLVARDTNGKSDVYQYDVASGTVHLITSGVSGSNSYFLDASPDGSDVFYVTRERRVGWDVDTSVDLYDARVNGGFPGPLPAPVGCREDDCQGPSSTVSQSRGPGSDGLEGVGDVAGGSRSLIGSVGKLSLAARSALARGAKVRLRVTVNRAGKVTLTGTAKIAGRTQRVASSSATAKKAGSVSVPFGLSQRARVQLRQRGSLRLSLVLRFNGVSPKVVSITLKAPRAAKSQKGGRS